MVHRIQEALVGLEMVLDRLVVPVTDGGVDAEPMPLGGDPRTVLLGAARRFGGRAEQVVGDLHERQPPGAPLLLRERVERCVVERELEPDVAEDAAEVHPHVGGRHGGEVAASCRTWVSPVRSTGSNAGMCASRVARSSPITLGFLRRTSPR